MFVKNMIQFLKGKNMRHKIPKFLERQTKFFNFLTFRQLAVVAGVGLGLLLLYYILPSPIFFGLALVTGGTVFILMFVQLEGMPLGKRLIQFMGFFTGSRTYIWKRRRTSHPIALKEREEKKEKKEESPLGPMSKSSLHKLSSNVETGFRQEEREE